MTPEFEDSRRQSANATFVQRYRQIGRQGFCRGSKRTRRKHRMSGAVRLLRRKMSAAAAGRRGGGGLVGMGGWACHCYGQPWACWSCLSCSGGPCCRSVRESLSAACGCLAAPKSARRAVILYEGASRGNSLGSGQTIKVECIFCATCSCDTVAKGAHRAMLRVGYRACVERLVVVLLTGKLASSIRAGLHKAATTVRSSIRD